MASFASIQALRDAIQSPVSQDYRDKMFHKIPEMEVVKDRAAYLIEKAKDKVVLDIGCTGSISPKIEEVAKKYYGVDKAPGKHFSVDLDLKPHELPKFDDVELVICSEFLEHLANPGWFLAVLKKQYEGRCVIFTVPNAASISFKDGCEVVNPEHVCWYSYRTLKVLLERYKFEIAGSAWYHGQPYKAEGLIMVVK